MEIVILFLWLGLGLALLYFGAEWLVKGAAAIALRLGISPLVVGLTVVAFGTSAPELLVSVQANLKDPPQGDLALGNVIGSNICNIALMLGIAALIRPLAVHRQVIRRELPILIVASLVFVAMLWDGMIARWEGGVLVAGILAYTVTSVRLARKEPNVDVELPEGIAEEVAAGKAGFGRDAGFIVLGLLALVYGADRLIFSGVALATTFGVPEAVIGLTLVALGTSLPELATTVVASLKGEGDLVTGNVIGSCIFNLLAVIGITGVIVPISSLQVKPVDLWVMLGVTVLTAPLLATRFKLLRWEGTVLVLGYLGYCTYLVQR